MAGKPLKIALLGFGTVGGGQMGKPFTVSRRDRKAKPPPDLDTKRRYALLDLFKIFGVVGDVFHRGDLGRFIALGGKLKHRSVEAKFFVLLDKLIDDLIRGMPPPLGNRSPDLATSTSG